MSGFLRLTVLSLVGAGLLLLVTESIARWLTRFDTAVTSRLATQASPGDYENLVAAIVGVEGFLLAMFYATLGIVASTSYQQVPAEVRQLFVRERSSQLFTRSVVRTLVLAILVLGVAQLGHQPHAFTLLVLVLLASFTVLMLVVVGTQLFNFFDSTSLSTQLPRRFSRALRSAMVRKGSTPDETRQLAAHGEAAVVLRLYRQLATLLAASGSTEVAGPRQLLSRAVRSWNTYSSAKSAIPTESRWFRQVPEHRDWLTMDHSRLSIALATRTSVQPDLVPDPLWVEKEMAQVVEDLFPMLQSEREWEVAIHATDELTRLVGVLSSRWQIEEALLLHRVVSRGLDSDQFDDSGVSASPTARSDLSQLASTERSVFTLISLWLGFIQPLRDFSRERLATTLEAAVSSPRGAYGVAAPHHLLTVLERLSAGIALEVRAEGRRVSPSWWVEHYGAKAMATTIIEATRQILQEATSVVERLEATATTEEPDRAAVASLSALELASKLKTHAPLVTHALEQLAQSRNDQVSDESWPEPDDWLAEIEHLEQRIIQHLATVSVRLSPELDKARPDLFGHAYKTMFDECFRAVLEGKTDLASALLPAVFYASDRARARLNNVLEDEHWETRFVYTSEPLIDLMELSGCAILMQELDGSGVWEQMRSRWDAILDSPTASELPAALAGTLAARGGVFALTVGGVERTARKQHLDRILESRGIVDRRMWDPFDTDPGDPHPSRIVAAFAPSDMGSFAELADLFVVHYLSARPGGDSLELSVRAQSLGKKLEARSSAKPEEPEPNSNDEEPTQQLADPDFEPHLPPGRLMQRLTSSVRSLAAQLFRPRQR